MILRSVELITCWRQVCSPMMSSILGGKMTVCRLHAHSLVANEIMGSSEAGTGMHDEQLRPTARLGAVQDAEQGLPSPAVLDDVRDQLKLITPHSACSRSSHIALGSRKSSTLSL